MKLLFDENLSRRHVQFLASESRLTLAVELQHILTLGWSGTPDHECIPRAVNAGFCIVTGDRNATTRGYTVADLKTMRARVLLLGPFFDHLNRWQRAKWLVARFEALIDSARKLEEGSVTMVDRSGKGRAL